MDKISSATLVVETASLYRNKLIANRGNNMRNQRDGNIAEKVRKRKITVFSLKVKGYAVTHEMTIILSYGCIVLHRINDVVLFQF